MDESSNNEGGEEFSEAEKSNIETALAEIKHASHELYEFLQWVGHHEDYDDEEFTQCLGAVYSYARAKNPSLERMEEEEDGQTSE